MERRSVRVVLWAAALGYLAWALVIGFWPYPVDRPLGAAIFRALDFLHARGLPELVDYGVVEFAANVWFFIPVGLLCAALLPRRLWWGAVLSGIALSGLIELGQLLFRSARYASWGDITANTIGAVVGVLVAVAIRAVIGRAGNRAVGAEQR